MRWVKVCSTKEDGGLGVRDLGCLNKAFTFQLDVVFCDRKGGFME